jgi:diguanylate cyclase (GGDEF)-like protein
MLATMFIDIDRFKTINDSLGHHIGDALLQQMGMRLLASVREEDTVARSGGDEFVVVAGRMKRAEDARSSPGRFCPASMSRTSSRPSARRNCSIGISLYPGDGKDIDRLLKHADTAMYHAKPPAAIVTDSSPPK